MKRYHSVYNEFITKEQGERFVSEFNHVAKGKCSVELIGSLASIGHSSHDIDVSLTVHDVKWAEDYLIGLDDDYANPFYTDIMKKLGAQLRKVGLGDYEDGKNNPDEWKWKGITVDVWVEEF